MTTTLSMESLYSHGLKWYLRQVITTGWRAENEWRYHRAAPEGFRMVDPSIRASIEGRVVARVKETRASRVQAGDKLDISAWVKYEKKANYTRGMPQSLLATVLGGTFAFTPGMETVPQAVGTFNSGLPAFMGITSGDGDTRPFAYLNYMLFNSSFAMVDAGAIRVPTAAGFDPGNEATSSPARVGFQPVTVSTTGYMYIWVSNP